MDVLPEERIKELVVGLGNNWTLENGKLQRRFIFKDFINALSFVNKVGIIAETEKHHPDIYLSGKNVDIMIYSHEAMGLTVRDFILAEKINEVNY